MCWEPDRTALATGLVALTLLTGCVAGPSGGADRSEVTTPGTANTADASLSMSAEEAAAQQRAQAWLEAAALPEGAVSSPRSPAAFNSHYGWPCRPVATLRGYWTIAGATVADTANWLVQHPTADLIVPMQTTYPADAGGASIGQVPAPDAQEGIVYLVVKTPDGVAIRAEIAAMYATATCPSLPPGSQMGGVGQG